MSRVISMKGVLLSPTRPSEEVPAEAAGLTPVELESPGFASPPCGGFAVYWPCGSMTAKVSTKRLSTFSPSARLVPSCPGRSAARRQGEPAGSEGWF